MINVLWLCVTQNLRDMVAFPHVTGEKFNPDREFQCGWNEVCGENCVPASHQQTQKMLADESGASCYKDSHQGWAATAAYVEMPFFNRYTSWSTIISTSSANSTFGCQPSSRRALAGSALRWST